MIDYGDSDDASDVLTVDMIDRLTEKAKATAFDFPNDHQPVMHDGELCFVIPMHLLTAKVLMLLTKRPRRWRARLRSIRRGWA